MNSGKLIFGALVGIACGALIGVLFAPDKGSEVRSRILKEGDEYLDSLKKRYNSILDSIAGKFNGGRVEVSDIGEHKNSRSKEVKRDMQPSAG